MTVAKDSDALKATFNSLPFPMSHYHYDTFEMKFVSMDISRPVSFFTDGKGNIGSFSVQLEPSVKEIVFTRVADEAMKEKSFLSKFAGEYELLGMAVKVFLKGEDVLVVSAPGQPDLELEPYAGTEFHAKSVPGVSVEFRLDASGAVVEAVLNQAGRTFTAKRKA